MLHNTQEQACLLLHGFGGTPFDVQALADGLKAHGITARAPMLPGHGTSLEEFEKTSFADWYAAAERELLQLQKDFSIVSVAGFSMGGLIALLLAGHYQVGSVITFAAPYCNLIDLIQGRSWKVLLFPLLQHIKPRIAIPPRKQESIDLAPYQGYNDFLCLRQYLSIQQGMKSLGRLLPNITCPALLFHDIHDRVAPPKSALAIAQKMRSSDISIHYLTLKERITSHHLLLTHNECKTEIVTTTLTFLDKTFR